MTDSPDLVTKYDAILTNNGYHKKIKKVLVTKPNLQGEQMGSVCSYVTLELTDGDKIELFVKALPTNATHSEMLKEFDSFKKEAEFFNVVLKDLQAYYMEKSGASKPMDFFPNCFYADEKEIILENLVTKHGYYLNPKAERQDLEHATMTLNNLAQLHAVSYAMVNEMENDIALQKYPSLAPLVFIEKSVLIKGMLENTYATAVGLLNNHNVPGSQQAMQIIKACGKNLWERIITAAAPDSSNNLYSVINHGDCWNNNMMFLRDPVSNKVKHHVLVDFQITSWLSPNVDLSYYMFTSVRPSLRKEHWESMLKTYFKKFTATVELLMKSSFPFTFEQFLQDFKSKSIIGFWMNVFFTVGMNVLPTLDATKMEGDMATFLDNATIDWIKQNPEKSRDSAIEIVEFCDEFEKFMPCI